MSMEPIKELSFKIIFEERSSNVTVESEKFTEFVPALNWLVNILSKPRKGIVRNYRISTLVTTNEGSTLFENLFRDRVTAIRTLAAALGSVAHETEELAKQAFKVTKGGEN